MAKIYLTTEIDAGEATCGQCHYANEPEDGDDQGRCGVFADKLDVKKGRLYRCTACKQHEDTRIPRIRKEFIEAKKCIGDEWDMFKAVSTMVRNIRDILREDTE